MNTPDTEGWKESLDYKQAIYAANKFLDEPYIDPDGDECTVSRQFLRMIERYSSRDTYWKERVREEVETEIAEAVELTKREIKHRVERYFKGAYLSLKQQGGVHIHLEEIQEIIDDSTPPGFDLTPLQDKFNK